MLFVRRHPKSNAQFAEHASPFLVEYITYGMYPFFQKPGITDYRITNYRKTTGFLYSNPKSVTISAVMRHHFS
jgi:hypothetical protein